MGEDYLFYKRPPFYLDAQAIVGRDKSVVIRFLSPAVTIQSTARARFIIGSTGHLKENDFVFMPLFNLAHAVILLLRIDPVRIEMVNEIQIPRWHLVILDIVS
jgi:hypothetical protein